MAQLMIAHIDKKRKALGIDKARDRVSSWTWPIVGKCPPSPQTT
jgi:hypothetical protein